MAKKDTVNQRVKGMVAISGIGSACRSAWKRGQKTVLVADRRFEMKKVSHKVTYRYNDQVVKRREDWLVVTPVGGQLPLYNLELTRNSRVSPSR